MKEKKENIFYRDRRKDELEKLKLISLWSSTNESLNHILPSEIDRWKLDLRSRQWRGKTPARECTRALGSIKLKFANIIIDTVGATKSFQFSQTWLFPALARRKKGNTTVFYGPKRHKKSFNAFLLGFATSRFGESLSRTSRTCWGRRKVVSCLSLSADWLPKALWAPFTEALRFISPLTLMIALSSPLFADATMKKAFCCSRRTTS